MAKPRSGRFASITSVLALVVAVSGAAFAAATVTSADIVDKTIKKRDISTATRNQLLPKVFSGFHDSPIQAQNNLTTPIAALDVPKGKYMIVGKAQLFLNVNTPVDIHCRLQAGGDFDEARMTLEANSGGVINHGTIPFNLVHTFASPGTIEVFCNSFGVDVDVSWIKITATRVGTIKNTSI